MAFDWSTAQLVSQPSSTTSSGANTSQQGKFDWSTAQLVSAPSQNTQPNQPPSQGNPQDTFPSFSQSPQFSGSPQTLLQRGWMSRLTPDEQVAEYKKTYKYVQPLPDGRISVGDDINSMKPVSSPDLMNDFFGHLADNVTNIGMGAAMTAGSMMGAGLIAPAVEGAEALGGAATLTGSAEAMASAGKTIQGARALQGLTQAVGAGVGGGALQAGIEATKQDNSPQNAAGRVALQTAFGAATDGLLQGIGAIGNKLVPPKMAKLWEDDLKANGATVGDTSRPDLAEYIARGKNPSPVVNFQQTLFKLTSDIDPRDVHANATFGPQEITGNPNNQDPNFIYNLAARLIKAVKGKDSELGEDLETKANAFGNKNPNAQIDPNPAYQSYLANLERNKLGNIVRDKNGDIVGFNFTQYPNAKQDVNLHKQFMQELQKLGPTSSTVTKNDTLQTSGSGTLDRGDILSLFKQSKLDISKDEDIGKMADRLGVSKPNLQDFISGKSSITSNTFILPSQLKTMTAKDALGFQQGTKIFAKQDPNIYQFFKTSEEKLAKGVPDTSIYGEFDRIANAVGNPEAKAYLLARSASASFKTAVENMAGAGLDLRVGDRLPSEAISTTAKYLDSSTRQNVFAAQAMDALQAKLNNINFVQPSLEHSANQGFQRVHPNWFRFGMLMNFLTSPFGGAIPGLNLIGGAMTSTPQGLRFIMNTLGGSRTAQQATQNATQGLAQRVIQSRMAQAIPSAASRALLQKLLMRGGGQLTQNRTQTQQ